MDGRSACSVSLSKCAKLIASRTVMTVDGALADGVFVALTVRGGFSSMAVADMLLRFNSGGWLAIDRVGTIRPLDGIFLGLPRGTRPARVLWPCEKSGRNTKDLESRDRIRFPRRSCRNGTGVAS